MALQQGRKAGMDEIEIYAFLDPLFIALGATQALARSMDDKHYIDALLDVAFEEADEKFLMQADALALAGSFPHMYEWGTIGVNPSKTNVRMRVNNPNARLWHTYNIGSGMDRTVGFVYRPSVANVPKPTTSKTGMSKDVIESMRDYQFTWKAEVIEEDQRVTIKPKRRFLLIPNWNKQNTVGGKNGWRTNDVNRGYILLRNPVTASPGRSSYGVFTETWTNFWMGEEAGQIIDDSLKEQVEKDFFPEVYSPRKSGTMRPIGTFNVRTEIEKNAQAVRKRTNAKARLRRRKVAFKKRAAANKK